MNTSQCTLNVTIEMKLSFADPNFAFPGYLTPTPNHTNVT